MISSPSSKTPHHRPAPTGGNTPQGTSAGAQAVAARSAQMTSAPTGGPQAALAQDPDALARFPTFNHVVDLIRANRDMKLCVEVEDSVRLVAYQPGRIEVRTRPKAPRDLAQRSANACKAGPAFAWRLVGGIIAPVCVFVVFVYTLLPVFEALPAYFSGIIESIQARIN